jgi:sterol desaturase/sphingolipid hydroxylase (fatty acid hydroxylase superfamily)
LVGRNFVKKQMETLKHFFLISGFSLIRYFLFAGIPFLIFYRFFLRRYLKAKIQERQVTYAHFLEEIKHSVQSTFIFAGVGLLFLHTDLRAHTLVYSDLQAYPIWWLPVTVLIALLLHDSYFYWLHRLVHHPRLFRYIHLTHHRSTNPSPWTSYSFHVLEALLEAMILPILLFVLPMHPLSILLFVLSSFTMNVYGHLGFEVAPRWFRHSILFEILNTSVHHNLHHAKFKGNYGLYFRVWDRLLGTEHPDYIQTYDQIQERRFGVEEKSKTRSFNWLGLSVLLLPVGLFSQVESTPLSGTWIYIKTQSEVRLFEKEGKYYGQLIATGNAQDDARIQGKTIYLLKDFALNSKGIYQGTLFLPRRKWTVAADLEQVAADTLQLWGRYGALSKKDYLVRKLE